MNRLKQFSELFRFRIDICSQSSKTACLRSKRQRGDGLETHSSTLFRMIVPLNGQCKGIFDHFLLKRFDLGTYEQTKTVLRTFSFSRRCLQKTCVRIVSQISVSQILKEQVLTNQIAII